MTDIHELKPYKSLLLTKIPPGIVINGLVKSILDESERILGLKRDPKRTLLEKSDAIIDDPYEVAYLSYVVESSPSWTNDPNLIDHLNHLLLVARRGMDLVFYLSESNKRSLISGLLDQGKSAGFGALIPVSQYILNNAYLKGVTRTLWLSGTHRRTTIKADSKVLAGLDLRDALDPLEDQTYYFTAARSMAMVGGKVTPVGCAPRSSRIWSGLSSSWGDFKNGVGQLLDLMDQAPGTIDLPFPSIAYPMTTGTDDLLQPFEIAFMPPETDDPNIDLAKLQEIERWGYNSKFVIQKVDDKGKHIEADLLLNANWLGTVIFDLSIDDDGRVRWQVDGKPNPVAAKVDFDAGIAHAGSDQWVKIWYESGLTVAGGQVYNVHYRDYAFGNYKWVDFTGFSLKKEKPDHFPGQLLAFEEEFAKYNPAVAETSLFGWIYRFWPNVLKGSTKPRGWLTCDDGAGEVADFIHIGEEDGVPLLTLIHVKASKTTGISVADYEVVSSQAVKNLRWLDNNVLHPGLESNLKTKVATFTWHDDQHLPGREEFIEELKKLGTNYKRRVVIFQPSLSRTLADNARKEPANKKNSNLARLRLLDSLLLGKEANCHSMNAELWVVGNNA